MDLPRPLVSSFVLALALAAAPVVAFAQRSTAPPPSATESRARAVFEEAAQAFADARFAEALEGFEQAFTLSGRVALQYNMALCHDRLGHDAEALAAFERYLEGQPDAPNRADVEQRISTIRARISAHEELERRARDVNRPPPHESVDEGSPTLGWVLAGSGGVLVIGGVISLFVGLADVSAIENAAMGASWADDKARYDRGPTLEWVGGIGLGVGAALAATGLVLALSAGRSETQLAIGPSGITLRGRF